jgi:hypothetical protein
VQGSALAKIFRIPEAEAGFAAILQSLLLAAVVELIIVLCMVSFEVLSGHQVALVQADPVSRVQISAAATEVSPTKPKLVVSNPSKLICSVKRILTDNLERCPGGKVEIAEVGFRYRDVCRAEGKRSVSQDVFIAEVGAFCDAVGIKRKTIDGHLYLLNVKLTCKGVWRTKSRTASGAHAGAGISLQSGES